MKKVLVLGGGHTHFKRMDAETLNVRDCVHSTRGFDGPEDVTTIDINTQCRPTHVFDLNDSPWPINAPIHTHAFDECHAYEILEHLGHVGNVYEFFHAFAEIWWALRAGGLLFASVPSWRSLWAFGDPGHTRVINAGSLVFLQKSEYKRQLGRTAMSDYSSLLVGDWELLKHDDDGSNFRFILRAK